MKKTIWICIIVVIIAGIATVTYKKNKAPVVTYREISVKRDTIDLTVLSTGTVAPENRVDIKAPVAGRADEVLVKEGQAVKKGQVLIWMSSTERAALIDAATSKGPDELKRWKDMYLPTPVLAPIDGVIIVKNVESGQTFATTDAILTMSDRLTVQAQVDETDIAKVKLKQDATITLDAYPSDEIEARVDKIAYDATTTNNVTVYKVDVLPIKTPLTMRSGMTANVTFLLESHDNILVVPTEAIKVDGDKSTVSMRDEKGLPIPHEITTGVTDGSITEVKSGLKEGDIVLIEKINLDKKDAATNPFMPSRMKGKKSQGPPHP